MEEIWKDIKGYEGKYQVSNLGNVRSVDRFVLSTSGRNRFFAGRDIPKRKEDFGYEIVSLSDRTTKRKRVHRLVAEAFLPNPDNLPCVNHKDRNPSNNLVFINKDGSVDYERSNLEWCTVKYNVTYSIAIELRRSKMLNNHLSVPVAQFSKDGKFIKKYPSRREAQRQTGIRTSVICNACAGRYHTGGGFIWRYINELSLF